ncbi:MAG: hypothetical protein IK056_05070, partial [Clostridia bacterium]|nr:hypothetical protein [Clostridia bacterium]
MKDNKYTRFAQKIEPSEEFAEQTMEKLRGKGSKHYKWLPALTSLTAVAAFLLVLALALPQIYSPRTSNTDASKPDMTTAADTVKQDNATVSAEPEEPADGGMVYEFEALYEDSAYEVSDTFSFMSSAMYATPMPMQKNAYMPEDFNTEE